MEDQPPIEEEIAESRLASGALGEIGNRIEGVAQIAVDHEKRQVLSHLFTRDEIRLYSRMRYGQQLKKAVGESDEFGFSFPDFYKDLIVADYENRNSYKKGLLNFLESITKIFERGDSGRRGGLFSRRG